VKVILVGYQLTYAPEEDQDIHRLIAQAPDPMPDFHILMIVHQLKHPDLMWIISLGSFRTAYRLVRRSAYLLFAAWLTLTERILSCCHHVIWF